MNEAAAVTILAGMVSPDAWPEVARERARVYALAGAELGSIVTAERLSRCQPAARTCVGQGPLGTCAVEADSGKLGRAAWPSRAGQLPLAITRLDQPTDKLHKAGDA